MTGLEQSVSGQLTQAAWALTTGAALALLYELLRLFRTAFPGRASETICDLLFCAVSAVSLILLGWCLGGRQRVFFPVLAFLGAVLTRLTVLAVLRRMEAKLGSFLHRERKKRKKIKKVKKPLPFLDKTVYNGKQRSFTFFKR